MSRPFPVQYAVPLVLMGMVFGCVVAPTDPDVLGTDGGQGGRPTYGTPAEQGLVKVYTADEAAKKPRPRGTDYKANHSPRPTSPVVLPDTPTTGGTPSGPPSVSGADITHAAPGTKIAISGSNFGSDKAIVKVTFAGDKDGVIDTIENGKIIVAVPEGAIDGNFKVTVGTNSATAAFPFDVHGANAPTISGIAPEIGKFGDPIVVTGTNFGTDVNKIEVTFGTVKALITEVTEVTDTQITVKVPQAFSGNGPIKVKKIDTQTQKSDEAESKQTFKSAT